MGLYDFRERPESPTLARWIKVDPLGFTAGDTNFYRVEANRPTTVTDPTGLDPTFVGSQTKSLDPDPNERTVVGDGKGGLTVQLGGLPPDANRFLVEGVRRHEQTHIKDLLAKNPYAGVGVEAGRPVRFVKNRDEWQSEVNASNAEIEYLREVLRTERLTDVDRQWIKDRIAQMEDYRNGFLRRLEVRPPERGGRIVPAAP